jgi:hypothetical protein
MELTVSAITNVYKAEERKERKDIFSLKTSASLIAKP